MHDLLLVPRNRPFRPAGCQTYAATMSAEFIYVFLPGDRPELATDLSAWTAADERVSEEHHER